MIKWLREEEAKYQSYLAIENSGRGWQDSAGAFIDWLEASSASPFVSMEDRPPEVGQDIVALHGTPLTWMFNGFWADVRKYCAADELCLDYWMPMPPPPRKETQCEPNR